MGTSMADGPIRWVYQLISWLIISLHYLANYQKINWQCVGNRSSIKSYNIMVYKLTNVKSVWFHWWRATLRRIVVIWNLARGSIYANTFKVMCGFKRTMHILCGPGLFIIRFGSHVQVNMWPYISWDSWIAAVSSTTSFKQIPISSGSKVEAGAPTFEL